jgi:Spy/CpxP family protein refolding chaperone
VFNKRSLSVALCAAGISLAAAAHQDARAALGEPRMTGRETGIEITDIDLTGAQGRQIAAIHQASMAEVKPIEQAMRSLKKTIAALLNAPQAIDAAQLNSLAQQVFALEDERDAVEMSQELQFRQLLSPAQMAKAAQQHQQYAALHPLHGNDEAVRVAGMVRKSSDFYGDKLGFARGVKLTASQDTQDAALESTAREELAAIESQRAEAQAQIADGLFGPPALSDAALQSLQQQTSQLRDQLDQRRLDLIGGIRTILTPMQLSATSQIHGQLVQLHRQEKALTAAAKTVN